MYTVRRATADVNVQRNRDRNVHESWLELLDEVRTVAAAAWEELEALNNDFIFRAPRERAQRANRASTRQLRQEVSTRDAAFCGVTFTEDDVNWKVLAVTWSPTEKVVIVWYCDVDAAAEGGGYGRGNGAAYL